MAVDPERQIIDPDVLGGVRDAFEGEEDLLSPAKENDPTLTRLMKQAAAAVTAPFESIKGQIAPNELAVLQSLARRAGLQARAEYLEAFRTNPAVIIQKVILDNFPAQDERQDFRIAIDNIDSTAENFVRSVETLRQADIAQDREPRSTLDCFGASQGEGKRLLTAFRTSREPSPEITDQVFAVLRDLGGLPSPEISNFAQLQEVVPISDFSRPLPENIKVYRRTANGTDEFTGLRSNRPGLEGLTFGLGLNAGFTQGNRVASPYFLEINGSPELCARIVEQAAGYKAVRPAEERRLRR